MNAIKAWFRKLHALLLSRRVQWWLAGSLIIYTLLGFVVAPWALDRTLTRTVQNQLGAELRIGKTEVNPFFLSVRLKELEFKDPDKEPVFRAGELFANFQLSSVVRWAWTFDEISATSPELFLSRSDAGILNLAKLTDSSDTDAQPNPESEGGMARAIIFRFTISNWTIHWRDEVPVEMVNTRFGPINIEIFDLNTLPQRPGQQSVLITTETQGTLSWDGELQVNPLRSAGHASIRGSHFPLTSAYVKHQSGFNVVEGDADAELDYVVDTLPNGTLTAQVNNFNLAFNDVVVETFSGAAAADTAVPDLEILRLPEVRLENGSLRWPEKTVAVDSLSIDDALVSVFRDEAGRFNVEPKRDAEADDELQASDQAQDEPWSLSLGELVVNRLEFDLDDHSVDPFADVGASDTNLRITDISNAPGASFPLTFSTAARAGGTIALDGHLSVLPAVGFEFDVSIDDLQLAGGHPYIQPLADLNLDSGAINVTGKLGSSAEDPARFDGHVQIVELDVSETDQGTRIGSWKSLDAGPVSFSAAEEKLSISEITLVEPYGDIVIAEDGTVNLGRISKGGPEAIDVKPEAGSPEANGESGDQFAVEIGRVVLQEASADFADNALPIPFAAKIENLNGDFTTISTSSAEPSTVSLEGTVDEFGFVKISGSATPLRLAANTDLLVTFRNVNMPKFTSYTIPFAGREIASGSMDLDLSYKIQDSQLQGDNIIVLRDLELGDEVDHPDAMSLPLGLAVALLKDPEGKIDIDLPVSGDIGDPEFSYGGVIMSALGNLLLKIVTSPFALLGNLVGAEADELEYIAFLDGRSDLTPPEMEKVGKLAEALVQRPQLSLEINGVIDREADGLAMRTIRVDETVEQVISELAADGDDQDMYADQRQQVLETLYTSTITPVAENETLEALRIASTATVEGEEPQFDQLAYMAAMREKLIEEQLLSEEDFVELAKLRAESVRSALLAANATLVAQLISGALKEVSKKEDEPIEMQITLTSGATPATDELPDESSVN